MVNEKGGKRARIMLYALIAFFIVIAAVAAWKYFQSQDSSGSTDKKTDEQTAVSTSQVEATAEGTPPTSESEDGTESTTGSSQSATPDPVVFSSLDIEAFSTTVYYTKGVGAFSYEIMKTSSGTSYIEFQSEELMGTKCTDDKGAFASIIKNPSTSDVPTLEATTKVDGVEYGLSLAGSNCTPNMTLLEKFQLAFKAGFSSLRAYPQD